MIWDTISLLFAVLAGYVLHDWVAEKWFDLPSVLGDEFLTGMALFFYVFGLPLLSTFTSVLTFQTVHVDANEIRLDSLFGREALSWSDLCKVELQEQGIVVPRQGLATRRTLQTQLILSGTRDALAIHEPQLRSIKKRLIDSLLSHAPDSVRERLYEVLREW